MGEKMYKVIEEKKKKEKTEYLELNLVQKY